MKSSRLKRCIIYWTDFTMLPLGHPPAVGLLGRGGSENYIFLNIDMWHIKLKHMYQGWSIHYHNCHLTPWGGVRGVGQWWKLNIFKHGHVSYQIEANEPRMFNIISELSSVISVISQTWSCVISNWSTRYRDCHLIHAAGDIGCRKLEEAKIIIFSVIPEPYSESKNDIWPKGLTAAG